MAQFFREHILDRVDAAAVKKIPNLKVFYLRYRPLPPFAQDSLPTARAIPGDDLEHNVRALDAKVFVTDAT